MTTKRNRFVNYWQFLNNVDARASLTWSEISNYTLDAKGLSADNLKDLAHLLMAEAQRVEPEPSTELEDDFPPSGPNPEEDTSLDTALPPLFAIVETKHRDNVVYLTGIDQSSNAESYAKGYKQCFNKSNPTGTTHLIYRLWEGQQ